MPTLVATRLQNARANVPAFNREEIRASEYGAMDAFMLDTASGQSIVNEELVAQAARTLGRTLQIPVLNGENITIRTTRPITVPGTSATSALVNVTFATAAFSIHLYPAVHQNNEISMQRYFQSQLEDRLYALAANIEAACIAKLEAEKSQVLSNTLGGRFTFTGNTALAPNVDAPFFVGDIDKLMRGNKYPGPIRLIHNLELESVVDREIREKRQFNSEDKTYQVGNKTLHNSNFLTNPSGSVATAYAVKAGSLGMLHQFETDALLATTVGEKAAEFGTDVLPILGLPCSTFNYEELADASGLGADAAHLTRTKREVYDFVVMYALVTPYLSDKANDASPILKVALQAAV